MNLARDFKKAMKHDGDGDTSYNCTFSTVPKVLEEILEEVENIRRIEPNQAMVLLKSDRILRIFLENWVNMQSLKLRWMASS